LANRETFKTPVVTFVYPKITKPDTYGPKADGRFKTQFQYRTADGSYDKERSDKQREWLKAKAEQLGAKGKPKMPWNVDEETGEVTFRAGSKYRPLVVDTKNNKVPEDLPIGGGSQGRLGLGLNFYDGRLSLYLNEVQLTKFVEYKRKDRESSFEAVEDGFVVETTTEASDDEGEKGSETGELVF